MVDFIIRPLTPGDHENWMILWEGYNQFYERTIPEDVTESTWARFFDPNEPVHALVADQGGSLVGIVHYLFHRNTAMIAATCYLQDLFTVGENRRAGIGRCLIERVYQEAQSAGSTRVYWLTHETNARAIALYEQVAQRTGFIQYRKELGIS